MAQGKRFAHEIQYTKVADKFFKAHANVREEYREAIKELLIGDHPERIDVKRIRGEGKDHFRIRLRGWRVVYAVINGKIAVIDAIPAGARGDAYKKTDGLK